MAKPLMDLCPSASAISETSTPQGGVPEFEEYGLGIGEHDAVHYVERNKHFGKTVGAM